MEVIELKERRERLELDIEKTITEMVAQFEIDTNIRPSAIGINGVNILKDWGYISTKHDDDKTPMMRGAEKRDKFAQVMRCTVSVKVNV